MFMKEKTKRVFCGVRHVFREKADGCLQALIVALIFVAPPVVVTALGHLYLKPFFYAHPVIASTMVYTACGGVMVYFVLAFIRELCHDVKESYREGIKEYDGNYVAKG